MLNRLVTLAIVLAIVYLVVTRGLPWIQRQMSSYQPVSSEYRRRR